MAAAEPGFQAGFVALVGFPNVGKSTLLNRLVETRLSIVTSKAQTTRRRRLGIYTDQTHQAVFVDTPGLLEPRYPLQEAMRKEIGRALADTDVVVGVVDAAQPDSLESLRATVAMAAGPRFLCVNKVDTVSPALREAWPGRARGGGWAGVFRTVAVRGRGIDALREAVVSALPPSPPLYPAEDLSTHSMRELAADLIRKACFERLSQEVPYSVAVKVEEYRDSDGRRPCYIEATVYVERKSQKGIVVGRGGATIRQIGTAARKDIEDLVGGNVYLDLRVRVLANWRRRPKYLKLLGFEGFSKER